MVEYIHGIEEIDNISKNNQDAPKEFYLWKDNDSVYIMGKPNNMWAIDSYFKKSLDLCKKSIFNIDNIEYFHLTGQKLAITKGEGGGSSLGGAVVGGLLFGGVGAIAGSRKKTNIDTDIVDERNTVLVYNNPQTKQIEHIIFSAKEYDIFLKLIPNKELEYVRCKTKII